MSVLRGLSLTAGFALAMAAQASVVVNPVAQPIAPGITVAIDLFGTAPAIEPGANRLARIQQMKPIGDGSGRLFLNDTSGRIEVMGAGGGTPSVWFDVHPYAPGFGTISDPIQQGLMSFAFHPNFAGDPNKPGYGTFYVLQTETKASGTPNYVANGPVDHHNVVREFTVADPTAASADIVSSREVLRVSQPYRDHGPGMISFNTTAKPGDADYGNLYIGMGDGGGWADQENNAQDLASPLGKIMRINPLDPDGAGAKAYSIPTDNPFLDKDGNTVDGKLGEVWAYGLRNPQQFSWDPATGKMVLIDIGFSQLEEVNIGQAGANYGWPIREGTYARADRWGEQVYDEPLNDGSFVDPIAQYDHEEIFRSGQFNLAAISSAFVYHGSIGELQDMVVLSDLVTGRVFYFPFEDGLATGLGEMRELFFSVDGVVTSLLQLQRPNSRVDLRLSELENGELAFLFKVTGQIWAMQAVPEPATWAMMILGFGMVGAVARRRRAVALRA